MNWDLLLCKVSFFFYKLLFFFFFLSNKQEPRAFISKNMFEMHFAVERVVLTQRVSDVTVRIYG